MASKVLLIHGWSATADSMLNLRRFLEGNGYGVDEIHLSQYISLRDDVRVEDVVKRLRRLVPTNQNQGLDPPFDVILHSTGGLVAREWITQLLAERQPAPIQRLIMLAPANFGSKLAAAGKSMIGRVVEGWDNWFQVGKEMLTELELGSQYTWDLARRDLISPNGGGSPYGPGKIWAFVICGTRGATSGLTQIANESGSDDTMRPAAANINVTGVTLDFSKGTMPTVTPWQTHAGAELIPFALLPDRSHQTIVDPLADVGTTTSEQLGQLILQALHCKDDATYGQIAQAWQTVSENTGELSEDPPDLKSTFKGNPPAAEDLHQFYQVVVKVRDDQGQSVPDYFLEFFSPEVVGEEDSVLFHQKVLRDVHVNSIDPSMRCLFLDRSALMNEFYDGIRKSVALSISAAPLGDDVHYFTSIKQGAKGQVIVHHVDEDTRAGLPARLRHNQTNLVEIIIPREPSDPVFALVP